MATCDWCNGTGKRHYTLVERHPDGTSTVKSVSYVCEWCRGKGQRKTVAEIVEVETVRQEGLRG